MFSRALASRLSNAESVTVFTGAGISAESGVPTFRGKEGLWKKFKVEELANFDAFMRDPRLVWEWYRHRMTIVSSVVPNPGHYAIAEMENLFKDFSVITQNIDNLHQRAGSRTVYELHGSIERNFCIGCGRDFPNDATALKEAVPRCDFCSGLIRPDVVWFGELIPGDIWNRSVSAAERAEVFFSIGTSGVVYPAASLPSIAKRAGAYFVEINVEPTELTSKADEFICGKSASVLPRLLSIPHPGHKHGSP